MFLIFFCKPRAPSDFCACLVGSEMYIRDGAVGKATRPYRKAIQTGMMENPTSDRPVAYTHLTLPTDSLDEHWGVAFLFLRHHHKTNNIDYKTC